MGEAMSRDEATRTIAMSAAIMDGRPLSFTEQRGHAAEIREALAVLTAKPVITSAVVHPVGDGPATDYVAASPGEAAAGPQPSWTVRLAAWERWRVESADPDNGFLVVASEQLARRIGRLLTGEEPTPAVPAPAPDLSALMLARERASEMVKDLDEAIEDARAEVAR